MISEIHKKKLIEYRNNFLSLIDIEKEQLLKYGYGGYLYINESYRGHIIDDIKILNFESMYPHIMILLYEEGIIEGITKNKVKVLSNIEVETIKNYLLNKIEVKEENISEYYKLKYYVNTLYGKLLSEKSVICFLIKKYLELIYNDLLSDNNNIIYIDTDMIMSRNEFDPTKLMSCFIPYTFEDIYTAFIDDKKKYILSNNINELTISGFKKKTNGTYDDDFNNTISKMRERIRDRKLVDIGIN